MLVRIVKLQFKEEKINQMYPSIKSKESYHVPYSAVDSFYKNIEFNNTPTEKIFVSGAVSDVYPLRQYVLRYKEYIETLEHPTYKHLKHEIIDEVYYVNGERSTSKKDIEIKYLKNLISNIFST